MKRQEDLNEKYLSSTQKCYNKENSVKDNQQLNMTQFDYSNKNKL